MSNFFDYMYGVNKKHTEEKVVEDKAPKKVLTGGYFVFCKDSEGTLKKLIEAIGKHGNGGHSYDIVLDPDYKDEKETFFWDGDGSDRIDSIIAIPEGDGQDNPLLRMCLQTLDSINMQAKEASRKERKEWGEPPPTEEEREKILNNIIHDSHIILNGCQYADANLRACETIRSFIKSARNAYAEGLHPKTMENLMEDLEHIDKIAKEGLEEGITFLE